MEYSAVIMLTLVFHKLNKNCVNFEQNRDATQHFIYLWIFVMLQKSLEAVESSRSKFLNLPYVMFYNNKDHIYCNQKM